MLGAVLGDIAGSRYEFHPAREPDFPLWDGRGRFTDDTVCTCAVAEALMDAGGDPGRLVEETAQALCRWVEAYPHADYGNRFRLWVIRGGQGECGSWGNGSAMRVSPVGLYARTLEESDALARACSLRTHGHPEGIRGAQAVAAAVVLSKQKMPFEEQRRVLSSRYGYDLSGTVEGIRAAGYRHDGSCQGSVPQALVAFLESTSFEDAVRRAVWLGGDADTQAAMAGAAAQVYWGIPEDLARSTLEALPEDIRGVITRFDKWLAAEGRAAR